MDMYSTEFHQKTSKLHNDPRSPLLPSEKNNAAIQTKRTTPVRQIASGYKSNPTNANAPPKRYPSPNVLRNRPSVEPTLPKRAHSAERRRSIVPSSPSSSSCSSFSSSSTSSGPSTPIGNTLLTTRSNSRQHTMWPPMRSLSSAFQSETISIPVNKSKTQGRSSIPDQLENSSSRTRWHPTIGGKVPVTQPKKSVPSLLPIKLASVPVPVYNSGTNRRSSSPANGRATPVKPVINALVNISDMKKGKKRASQIEEAYQLRLVDNKLLQWRFVNSRATEALSVQKEHNEGVLHTVYTAISELRDSVSTKRIDLQELMQEEKMNFLLNDQIIYLEQWGVLERDHSVSLSGSIGALKASTLRVPFTVGTKADLHAVKNAVSSAVDVMQAMGSSVCSLINKVEDTKRVVSELCTVALREKIMLDEYRELLSMAAQLQVQDSSLRTQLMQMQQRH